MMRRMVVVVVGLLVGVSLAVGCLGEEPARDTLDGPKVTVDVAALNLAGIGDVVWDLEVINGAEPADVVWHQRITSSRFGDGAESASYVGPCDASQDVELNKVRLWVVGVYGAAVNVPGDFGDAPPAGALEFENPTPYNTSTETWAAPMSQEVECVANADRQVRFDVMLMRPAQQGFFDIAVNFNDIFCSAKFDCCVEDSPGVCGPDITLLHDEDNERATTFVLGFACTAGTGQDVETELYFDDLLLDCTSPHAGEDFEADFVIDPSGPIGNECTAGEVSACDAVSTSLPNADDYLFQVALYRGLEALTSGSEPANKVYWNVALGVVRKGTSTVGIEDCRLRTRATADDAQETELAHNGVITAGVVYPYLQWDVDLGSCGAEPLTFGDETASVRPAYTSTTDTGTVFPYGYGPGRPAGPFCAEPCVNGTCIGAVCVCELGWEGATCAEDIDDCDPNPCLNGGTCTDTGLASYTCACPQYYFGDDCEDSQIPTGFDCIPGTAECPNVTTGEVWVPAGDFWMGCDDTTYYMAGSYACPLDARPAHQVTLSAYAIDRYPVTAAQYEACANALVCEPISSAGRAYVTFGAPGLGNHPINWTTWYQAKAYCEWEGKAAGPQRLCTEAEWEKAARGGCETVTGDCRSNMRRHPWEAGDGAQQILANCSLANFFEGLNAIVYCYSGSTAFSTSPVDHYPGGRSPYGVYDMSGNVSEWVWDWHGAYPAGPVTDPQGPGGGGAGAGTKRVQRGGGSVTYPGLRAFYRYSNFPSFAGDAAPGFRCCRSLD